MTSSKHPEPALYSSTRRLGRYEPFRRFDNLSSGHASVGTKQVGKMTVDCRFLFKKSRWGVLGENQFPAGIVYLDLNFGPPQGCRLKNATVTVTLDDEDECLVYYERSTNRLYHESGCPVQMTDWYGPKQLVGEEKSTESKRTMRMTPEVHGMGAGVSGLGVESEKTVKASSRWTFNGQLLPGKETWTYKTLRWDLTDNELESQAFRSSCVHTAFAFEHSGQPFLMKVEIKGKLEKWNHRIRSRLKFGSGTDKDDGQTTTLIDFRELTSFKNPLDELARSLPRAMEVENYEATPVQMPDTLPASFQSTSPDARSLGSDHITIHQEAISQKDIENTLDPPVSDPTAPTMENVKQILDYLSKPPSTQSIHESSARSSMSASNTVVAEEEIPDKTAMDKDNKAKLVPFNAEVDQEAILRLIQIPALFAILQLLSDILDMFGAFQKK
ncbi:hypothetical protein F66182_3092 [Fusarium sp. NRRL 66182]|nr:hypothetical protein F66182_3092 [Fusarium sp. NRRL 66182]